MTSVRVVTLPESKGIPYRNEGYATYASIENIRVTLDKARAEQRRAARVVAWLEQVLARRESEIAAGTWPPPKPEEQP